ELFPQETANLLTVIDPRFHLGMSALSLRIVPARNQEDEATYDLVQASARSSRKSTNTDAANVDADPTSPWEREGITKKDWALLLRDLSKRKGKLDPPPRERNRRSHDLSGQGQTGRLTHDIGQPLIHVVPIHDARQHRLGEGAFQDGPARVGPDTPRRDD